MKWSTLITLGLVAAVVIYAMRNRPVTTRQGQGNFNLPVNPFN